MSKEPTLIREVSAKELENLIDGINDFMQGFDEHFIDAESVQLKIWSNGKITIGADFKSYTEDTVLE